MNAVVPLADDEPLPQDKPSQTAVPAVAVPAAAVASSVPLDEAVIARAIAEAARTGKSAVNILTESAGRAPADLARALARALDYRFVGGDELAMLEPAFDVLPPSEATRRCCAVVRTPRRPAGHGRRSLRFGAAKLARDAHHRSARLGASPSSMSWRASSRGAPRRCAPSTPCCRRPKLRAARAPGPTISLTSRSAKMPAPSCGWCIRPSTTRCAPAPATSIWSRPPTGSTCAIASTACW